MPSGPRSRPAVPPRLVAPLAVAPTLAWALFEHGAFSTGTWTVAAAAVWWVLLLAWALRGPVPLTAPVALMVAAFAGLAIFAGLSAFWGAGNDVPVESAGRILLYVGALLLALQFTTGANRSAMLDAVGLALVAIALLALAARFFPALFDASANAPLVPDAYSRLSYPIGYWNGLAVAAALAAPLALRRAISERTQAWAVGLVPALVTVAYLASSRTGMVTLAVSLLTFVALTRTREAVLSVAAAAVASLATVVVIGRLDAVVSGPFTTGAAESQGRWAALVTIAGGTAAVGLYTAARAALPPLPRRLADRRVLIAAGAVVLVAAVLAAHPVRRWQSFTATPPSFAQAGYINNHFLSSNGNWRYQFWQATVDEFRTRPVAGRGAGSFVAWWDQHGPGFVANPHSLYFETLGDLGLVGVALLAAVLVLGLVGAVRAIGSESRALAAAGVASFVGYTVAAGVDWLWQLPAVTAAAFLVLGAVLAPDLTSTSTQRRPLAIGAAVAALLVLLVELDLKGTDLMVSQSRDAAGRGDLVAAAADAGRARSLAPWAAGPRVQLALVRERQGRLAEAESVLAQAIRRDSDNWQLYFIDARIAKERGDTSAAAASLARARELNPNSSLLHG